MYRPVRYSIYIEPLIATLCIKKESHPSFTIHQFINSYDEQEGDVFNRFQTLEGVFLY